MNPEDALRETAYEVFETGMYVFLTEGGSVAEEALSFRMDIRGGPEAEVGLRASLGAARLLASQMLGCPLDEVSDADRDLAASEALNVIAGALLARTVGTGPELELCPPVAGGAPHGASVVFDTEGGALLLWYAARAA
jgi:hypothetical protein